MSPVEKKRHTIAGLEVFQDFVLARTILPDSSDDLHLFFRNTMFLSGLDRRYLIGNEIAKIRGLTSIVSWQRPF
jgi:hypothetical protein